MVGYNYFFSLFYYKIVIIVPMAYRMCWTKKIQTLTCLSKVLKWTLCDVSADFASSQEHLTGLLWQFH